MFCYPWGEIADTISFELSFTNKTFRSQLWGVIYIDSIEKAYGFREEDLDLLTALSNPVVLVIENAFLRSSENGKI